MQLFKISSFLNPQFYEMTDVCLNYFKYEHVQLCDCAAITNFFFASSLRVFIQNEPSTRCDTGLPHLTYTHEFHVDHRILCTLCFVVSVFSVYVNIPYPIWRRQESQSRSKFCWCPHKLDWYRGVDMYMYRPAAWKVFTFFEVRYSPSPSVFILTWNMYI